MPKSIRPEDPIIDVDLRRLVNSVNFDEKNLTSVMLNQSGLLLEAGYYRVEKMKARMLAEQTLAQTRTKIAQETRNREDIKITEGVVKEEVEGHEEVILAQKLYDEAKAMEEWGKVLIDAYQMRGSMIKTIVQFLGTQAVLEAGFIRDELDRMGANRLRDRVKSQFPGRS